MNNIDLIAEIITKMPKDLTDVEKVYYIYIRTCEIFSYDFRYNDSPLLIGNFIKNNYQNIKNIKKTTVVCSTWSKIFINLLKKVGIKASLITRCGHAWVESYIDGMIIYCDPTYGRYSDFSRVKHHDSIHHFFPVTSDKTDKLPIRDNSIHLDIEKMNKKIEYYENEEESLSKIEEKISKLDNLNDKVKCIFENAKIIGNSTLEDAEYVMNLLRIILKEDHQRIIYSNLIRINDDYSFDNKYIVTVIEEDKYNYYVLGDNLSLKSKEEILDYAKENYEMKPLYKEIGLDYPLKFTAYKSSFYHIKNIIKFYNKKEEKNKIRGI